MHDITRKMAAGIGAMAAALGCVIVTGPSAAADGKWCNNSVCIETYDSGTYLGRVEVSVTNTSQRGRLPRRAVRPAACARRP